MIKDDIKNPERIGMTPAAIVEGSEEAAIGLHSLKSYKEVGLVLSKRADDTFWGGEVKAMILSSEKAHALGKALIELSGIDEEPVEDKPLHISLEEFRELREGDKVIIRTDLAVDKYYGGTYFNANMRQWAADGVQLKVMPLRSCDGAIKAKNLEADDYFNYSREMIKEVIKAPKEHFRVRFSTKIWYAGKGGQITLDKDYAAIMNKPHAENVVKKYGGQLIKVDYLELEDK
ncbi:hypothetical protein EC55P2_00044 [Enterococcus phage EC55P2]|nr:hypothetical protein EC55P2_00044 [Enterococcus phage EC55P2]